jgi:prophage DNA circulation protein
VIDLSRLRRASFKGIGFDYISDDAEFAQRTHTHEFPQRDGAWHEPLGKAAETFEVEAVLVGTGYDARLKRLREACTDGQAGTLIHPRYGEKRVKCLRLRVKQSSTEKGLARLTLSFAEDIGNIYPTQSVRSGSRLAAAVADARQLLQDAFTATYLIANWRGFVADAAADLVGTIAGDLRSMLPSLPIDISAELGSAVDLLRDSRALIAVDAPLLVDTIAGIFRGIGESDDGWPRDYSAQEARRAIDGLEPLSALPETAPIAPTTEGRVQQFAALDAIGDFTRQQALITQAELTRFADFESYDDAVTLRDTLSDKLDAEILAAGDVGADAVVTALANVRAAMVADLTARGASLRPLASVMPAQTIPALVLAYQLYGEERDRAGRLALDRATDLVVRNRIRHPLFVAGGQQIEVIAPEDSFVLRQVA